MQQERERQPPDFDRFPALRLAFEVARHKGSTLGAVLNAANEVAVAAFLEGRLPFLGIADVVAHALAAVEGAVARDLDELIAADEAARRQVEEALKVA